MNLLVNINVIPGISFKNCPDCSTTYSVFLCQHFSSYFKWNVIIFIICHLTKTRMDTQPTMEDLKGSSSIGQEADTVILLWRESKRENGQVVITDNVNVSVQANRRGGKTGNVKMVYENGKFLEREWRNYKQDELDEEFQ